MTPQEFANKIRNKSPENQKAYATIPDEELARAYIKKFPVYARNVDFGFASRASEQIKKAGEEVYSKISGEGENADKSAIRRGVEATATGFTTPLKVGYEALPEVTRKGLSDLGEKVGEKFTKLADIISQVPGLEKWVAENPEATKKLEEVLGTTGALGEISADILSYGQGASGAQKALDKTTKIGSEIQEQVPKLVDEGVSKIKGKISDVTSGGGKMVEKLVSEPIPKPVETVLKETNLKTFDEYANVAKKATESFKNPTPLEIAGEKAQGALDTIQRKLKATAEQKSAVLNKAAVGNKPVGNIVVKFRQQVQNYLKGKTAVEGDTKLFKDVMSEAEKLGANPSATEVDKFIDFVQDKIYTAGRDLTVPITDESTGILRKITGELNGKLKAQLPENYSSLNDRYSRIVDVRNELNTKLGKEGERGGSLMKRVFSPSDARTKALFEEVKVLTGVDLVNEATLARFMMEVAGDARQASLLEQLQIPKLSKAGLLDFIFKKVTGKFNTPEAQLNRARELLLK